MTKSRRQHILDTVNDLVASFMYYDRKEDSDLKYGDIQEAVKAGEITYEEIVAYFKKVLQDASTNG